MDSKEKNAEQLSNLVESLFENLKDIFSEDYAGIQESDPDNLNSYKAGYYDAEIPVMADYTPWYSFDKQKYETVIAEAILKLVESDRKVIVKMLIDSI